MRASFPPRPVPSMLAAAPALVAFASLLLVPPLAAIETAGSRAYGEFVDLSAIGAGVAGSGPAPLAEGSAPPAYDVGDSTAGETVTGGPLGLTTLAGFGQITVHAASAVPAADS